MGMLELRYLPVGMGATNCYLVMNKDTRELVIIDPGDDPAKIKQAVSKIEGKPVAVLLTHGHYDHMMASNQVKKEYHIPIYAPRAEREVLADSAKNLSGGWMMKPYHVQTDYWAEDGEVLHLAGFEIRMILTPGHTEGSCCYYMEEEHVVFCGDTIFLESCGRTDLPTWDMSQIRKSIHIILDTVPDDTELYPGHGEATTAAHEKAFNPFV